METARCPCTSEDGVEALRGPPVDQSEDVDYCLKSITGVVLDAGAASHSERFYNRVIQICQGEECHLINLN